MLAKLSYSVINATPKRNMIIELDNDFYQIQTYTDETTKDVKCISLTDGRTEKTITIEQASERICKFIATYKSKDKEIDCSVCHSSINLLITYLDNKGDGNVENWTKLLNREPLEIEGSVDKILTTVREGATVQLTEIGIIDKYKLYEPSNRICVVKTVNKYDCVLTNVHTNATIYCRRPHFKVMDQDVYYVFRLKCDMCYR